MKIRIIEDVPKSLFFNRFNYNVGDILTINKKIIRWNADNVYYRRPT